VGAFAADEDENKKKEDETIDMPEVLVSGNKQDGSAASGYRTETVKQVGPWGDVEQQDLPYSMIVVPSDLLRNQGAVNNTQQIIRMIPGAYDGFTRSNYGIVSFSSRGFGMEPLVDGVRLSADNRGINFADVEQIDIQNGFTGFLYGGGFAGGAVNLVLKRPTKERLNIVTVGNSGGSNYYTQGDFGGLIPGTNGKLGYRVNLVYDNGESARRYVGNRETGVTAAIDWYATDKLKFQFDISRQSWEQNGEPGGGVWAGAGLLPDPPKATRAFGQPWALIDNRTFRYGANVEWTLNDHIDVRAAYKWQRNKNLYISGDGPQFPSESMNFPTEPIPGVNTYDVWVARYDGGRNYAYGGNVFANFKFDTGWLRHKAVVGYSTTVKKPYSSENYLWGGWWGTVTWDDPYLPAPDWDDVAGLTEQFEKGPWVNGHGPMGGRFGQTGRDEHSTWTVGDRLSIGDGDLLTLYVGASHDRIHPKNLNWDTGKTTSEYDKSKWSPSVGVTYKPFGGNVSFYANWLQALEAGTIVPEHSDDNGIRWVYRNAREILAPTTSDQFEGGVKTTVNNNLLLTAAYFYINKANYYTERYETDHSLLYTQDGRNVHKGLELNVEGSATDRLRFWGGLQWMSIRYRKTNNDVQRDQTPGNQPVFSAKLFGEFEVLPKSRFYVTGGAYHTGAQRYGDSRDEKRMLPKYTIYDLGTRYETRLTGLETVFMLNIQNVTDRRYWTRASSAQQGDPRTLVFSARTYF
jgi:iron complex outermembrane receptor protein